MNNEAKSNNNVKVFTRVDGGILSKIIEYPNGNRVEIPINKDGSVKFYDDSKLIKKNSQ